jgi:hypothetical protein
MQGPRRGDLDFFRKSTEKKSLNPTLAFFLNGPWSLRSFAAFKENAPYGYFFFESFFYYYPAGSKV